MSLATRKLRIESLEPRRLLSRTLLVDDDHKQFTSAPYTSIQVAVSAAQAGNTIKVAAGTYPESVTVNKSLTIVGAGVGGSLSENHKYASIVDPPASAGQTPAFNLQANNIVIHGFTLGDLNADSAVLGSSGVQTSSAFSGYKILGNVIEKNTVGVAFASNGLVASTIAANTLHDNNSGPVIAAGNAIDIEQGASQVTISGNVIAKQNQNAVLVSGSVFAASRISIAGNVIDGAPITLIDVVNSSVTGNRLSNSHGNGITMGGGCSQITVSSNYVSGAHSNGVSVEDTARGNVIQGNTLWANANDGIFAGFLTSNNLFRFNTARKNGHYDLEDASLGSGTAGTANTWKMNYADTASPAGLKN